MAKGSGEHYFNLRQDKKIRSIRKALGAALYHATVTARDVIGRSVNDLPEYFLSVKAAEFIHKHYDSFTFSMEDTIHAIANDIEMDKELKHITRQQGKVDLIIRGSQRSRVKHLVEFKRGFKKENHLKDILRLAEFCRYSPFGHKTEKNYMVMVAPVTEKQMRERHKLICDYLDEIFGERIKVSVEYVDLTEFKSTRPSKRKADKTLYGGVWELKYSD